MSIHLREAYFFKPYDKTLEVDSDSIEFSKLSATTAEDALELAKIYCTIFNQDNIQLLKEFGIKGKTVDQGLWREEPYTFESAKDLIDEYISGNYFGVVAYAHVNHLTRPVGACVLQLRNAESLVSRGYEVPFTLPHDVEYWCGIDTFRLDLTYKSIPLKGVANKMRDEVLKYYKKKNPALIYSATNNPAMVSSWKNYGFTVIERETIFYNKYQAFMLV